MAKDTIGQQQKITVKEITVTEKATLQWAAIVLLTIGLGINIWQDSATGYLYINASTITNGTAYMTNSNTSNYTYGFNASFRELDVPINVSLMNCVRVQVVGPKGTWNICPNSSIVRAWNASEFDGYGYNPSWFECCSIQIKFKAQQ